MKFFVIKKVSAKSGKPYIALMCDMGYEVIAVSFDRMVIMRLTDMTVKQLAELQIDNKIELS